MTTTSGRRPRRSTGVALAAAAWLGACTPTTSPPPSAPIVPRALRITAQQGQSQARQDRDKADCQALASGQAHSSERWAQIFAGCMAERGYRVDDAGLR